MSVTSQEEAVVADFATLADPYRPELLAYCYRMLGSVDEAEDQVQETMLRAWRAFAGFEGRSSLRTWLYRIATNSCLRAMENRGRRPMPSDLSSPAADPAGPLGSEQPEVSWLQPLPDALVTGGTADPAAIVGTRASLRLALTAALQYLPARQRAVLILRDVLGWHAAEVADLLGVTPAAANSALQRARAHLAQAGIMEEALREPDAPADRALLDRYAAAFEAADVAALAELLRADAALEMPPQPYWFTGRDQVTPVPALACAHRAGPVPAAADPGQRAARVRRVPARAGRRLPGARDTGPHRQRRPGVEDRLVQRRPATAPVRLSGRPDRRLGRLRRAAAVTGDDLLAGALRYALRTVPQVTAEQLTAPTPCRDWDLRQLLLHACDSVAALTEGLCAGRVCLDPALPPRPADPVGAFTAAARRLLVRCETAPGAPTAQTAVPPTTASATAPSASAAARWRCTC